MEEQFNPEEIAYNIGYGAIHHLEGGELLLEQANKLMELNPQQIHEVRENISEDRKTNNLLPEIELDDNGTISVTYLNGVMQRFNPEGDFIYTETPLN